MALPLFVCCKKDTRLSDKFRTISIQAAKEYFETQSIKRMITLKSANGDKVMMTFQPSWERISSAEIEGRMVFSVPVKSNFSRISGENIQFNLLMVDIGEDFEIKTVGTNFLSDKNNLNGLNLSVNEVYKLAYSDVDMSRLLPKSSEVRILDNHFQNQQIVQYKSEGKTTLYSKADSKKNVSTSTKGIGHRYAPIPPREGCVDWYYVYTEYDEEGNLVDYWEDFAFWACPSEGGGGGGGGGGETPPPLPEIINEVQDSCLKRIVDTAINSNVKNKVALMIDSIFGGSDAPFLKFIDVTNLPSNVDGRTYTTTQAGTGIFLGVEIRLNRNILANASTQFTAATILHEVMHAYTSFYGVVLDESHNQMVTKYFNVMTNALRSMFPSMSLSHARSLTWAGLEGTPYYTNPPSGVVLPGNQYDVNQDYRNGTKGTKCPGIVE